MSIHYSPLSYTKSLSLLRVVALNYRKEISRKELDRRCEMATPRQWRYYSIASWMAGILRAKQPSLLYNLITANMVKKNRKPSRPSFYDSSRLRVGRQSFQNPIGDIFKRVDSDWMEVGSEDRAQDCFLSILWQGACIMKMGNETNWLTTWGCDIFP